jgi:hypothetical protein
LIIFNLIVI